ncbi:MAG: hypothetical protein ACFFAS_20500 [Promethearchaeota archaeon]
MQVELLSSNDDIAYCKVKNIELISYFKKSTAKIPVFLGSIQRNYSEIKALLDIGLIKANKPVKSYELSMNKLEDLFFESYQEKIDQLQEEIAVRKRHQTEILEKVESMEPEIGCSDYDDLLSSCVQFAEKSMEEINSLKLEKKGFKNSIEQLREDMVSDPLYKFILYLRNDNEIVFNRRTEDNENITRKNMRKYADLCLNGEGWRLLSRLEKLGLYKVYSPAKNYYITELGKAVDNKLKHLRWLEEEIEPYEKIEEELLQEEEFDRIRDLIGS